MRCLISLLVLLLSKMYSLRLFSSLSRFLYKVRKRIKIYVYKCCLIHALLYSVEFFKGREIGVFLSSLLFFQFFLIVVCVCVFFCIKEFKH